MAELPGLLMLCINVFFSCDIGLAEINRRHFIKAVLSEHYVKGSSWYFRF